MGLQWWLTTVQVNYLYSIRLFASTPLLHLWGAVKPRELSEQNPLHAACTSGLYLTKLIKMINLYLEFGLPLWLCWQIKGQMHKYTITQPVTAATIPNVPACAAVAFIV